MAELHKSFQSPLARPIDSVVLPGDSAVTIARVELGLTLYLDETLTWAHQGAARVLQSFLAVVPPDHLSWYSTSHMQSWRKLEHDAMSKLVGMVSLGWSDATPRHLFEFLVTDDVGCPSSGLRYREIDTSRAGRAGVLEVTLPQEYDPGYLLPIARAALEAGALWSGIGGYAVRFNHHFKADAFDVAWAWGRRYVGVDIQDAEQHAWKCREGLPGTNWITILGQSLAGAIGFDPRHAMSHPWNDPSITTEIARGNLLIRAGEAPTVGDSHRFDGLDAYREAAGITRNLLAPSPSFLGYFGDRGCTSAWFRRLVDGGWPE
ncbi:MAG: DUF3396 domain-containing protein [Sandaracinaceae bacterium]|nr:MAG: DUF3396 domain-containing protein [Sandaracinaceae bacterium]